MRNWSARVWFVFAVGSFLAGCNQNSLDIERSSVVAFSRSYGAAPAASPTPAAAPAVRGLVDRLRLPLAPFDREASDTLRMPLESLAAVLYLRDTGLFATSAAIGLDGHFPPEIEAFQRVIEDPGADAAFNYLIREGNPAGQLYGLCGLYFTNPRRFSAQVEKLREDAEIVFTMEANAARYLDVEEVLVSRLPTVVRIPSPGLPPEEWRGAAGMLPFETVTLDVAGGGYPCFLRWARPVRPSDVSAAADASTAAAEIFERVANVSRNSP